MNFDQCTSSNDLSNKSIVEINIILKGDQANQAEGVIVLRSILIRATPRRSPALTMSQLHE